MYGLDILCGISKVPFEIPHKISYPYIERYDFYAILKFLELLDLRAHKCFWNAPQHNQHNHTVYMCKIWNHLLHWLFDCYFWE